MIDRIRHDIQQRLDQLLAEVNKLRRALAALDPRERSTGEPKPSKSQPIAKRAAKTPNRAKPTPSRSRARPASTTNGATGPKSTAPGETKVKVLAALSDDQALTASEVANAAGLARPTVSTTLSRLAQTGQIIKADRGYRLPDTNGKTVSDAQPAATPATVDA